MEQNRNEFNNTTMTQFQSFGTTNELPSIKQSIDIEESETPANDTHVKPNEKGHKPTLLRIPSKTQTNFASALSTVNKI